MICYVSASIELHAYAQAYVFEFVQLSLLKPNALHYLTVAVQLGAIAVFCNCRVHQPIASPLVIRFALVMIAYSVGPSCVYVCAFRDLVRAMLVSSPNESSATDALSVSLNARSTIDLHCLSLSLSLGICGTALSDLLK